MSEPTCVNLKERFGSDYRIAFDEADRRSRREILDPWLLEVPCRFGRIYPCGGNVLGVMVDNHVIVAKRLAALDCCRLIQNGDREKTFLFGVEDFSAVAAIVLPWRRPKMTEAQRQAAVDRLATFAFTSRSPYGEN